MPEPAIQDPPRQVNVSMFDDETRKNLDAAFAAKGKPYEPAPPPTATAPAQGTLSSPATASTVDVPSPALAKEEGLTTKPPSEPVKPPAPPAEDKDKFVPGKMKAADWDRIKGERDNLRREVERLKAVSTVTDGKSLEALRKERDDLSARLRTVAIERDPQFEREFGTATKGIVDTAKAIVGLAHSDAIGKILDSPPSEARDAAVEKLMEGLPAYKQTQVAYALARMDEMRVIKQSKIAESLANWEKLQASQTEAQTKRENEMRDVFEKTLKEWTDAEKGLPVFHHRDNDDEWNSKVDGALELARSIFGGELDIESLSRAALWSAAAPILLESMAGLQNTIKELQADNDKLRGISPGADGNGGGVSEGDEDDVPKEIQGNYGKAIAALASKHGLQFR